MTRLVARSRYRELRHSIQAGAQADCLTPIDTAHSHMRR